MLAPPVAIARPRGTIPRRRVVLIAAVAVAFAFVLILLPGPHRDAAELGAAAGIGVLTVALAFLWSALPAIARLGMPVAYVAMVAVLVDGSGGTTSGLGGLFLLPALWLAISGSRAELVVGMVSIALVRALPVRLIGAPAYPSSDWRTTIVLGAVAIVACLTIQTLVHEARLRAAELRARATDLEQATERLTRQNEELLELDRLKDDFVRLVSHELRTPLTSIIGYLEIVTDEDAEPLTSLQRSFLGTVGRNVERLRRLVDELLFLVHFDSGRIELGITKVDMNLLLVEITEAVRPAASAKGIELKLAADRLPPVYCDAGRISQLVDALLANAITFTPEGGRIDVTATGAGAAIAIAIRDTGIGIPPDELPHVFGRFYRAASANDDAVPGIGLGLAVAQAVAAAHGATISAESTPGQGATFRLLLPTARPGDPSTSR